MQRTYVPGQAYAVPGSYSRWGSYYGHAYSPGYVVEDEYVYIETNLYDVATEKLIWSTQSETIILASDQALIKISFTHTGKPAGDCRAQSAAELTPPFPDQRPEISWGSLDNTAETGRPTTSRPSWT
jgi:hypothetical protein